MTIEQLEAQPRFTGSDTLFELERRFGEPAIGGDPIPNDGGLALLASAGELAEVEAVGAEVARLLHVPAGEIAVVLRSGSPARSIAGFSRASRSRPPRRPIWP